MIIFLELYPSLTINFKEIKRVIMPLHKMQWVQISRRVTTKVSILALAKCNE